MKITKREWARPGTSVTIWAIPLMSYVFQKSVGVKMNHLEWIWWLTIPSAIAIWFFINWKIKK